MLRDLRFAIRWLWRSPGLTLVAVVSLGVGIGLNSALFTVVDALLFKPLPVVRPDELIDLYTSSSSERQQFGTTSYPDYLDLASRTEAFEDLVGYSPMFGALGTDATARLASGEIVTGNYFKAFGVAAYIGRTLTPQDDGAGAPKVAVVSYRFWTRELGSAPDVAGRVLRIRGTPFTVVGVLPAGFTGMVPVLTPELWIPVAASLDVEPVGLHDVVPSPSGRNRLERRGDRWMFLRGRLKRGMTAQQAALNAELVMSRLAAAYPDTNRNRFMSARRTNDVHFHPSIDAQLRPIAWALMALVTLVLLVACMNVAGMLLARASSRQREIGIRIAIGASHARLLRQLLTESVLLALLGALVGVLLAWWSTSIAGSLRMPVPVPLAFDLHIDLRVLAFTLAIALITGVASGVIPAVQMSKVSITQDLRVDGPTTQLGKARWSMRDLLVAGQMAVTVVLLVAAALLTRSVIAAERTNLGFPVDRIALVSVDASQLRYTPARTQQFYDQALERIRALAGVDAAGLATRPPFSMNFNRWEIWIPRLHQPGQHGVTVEVTSVSPEYFDVMDIPIVSGRIFTAADRPETPRVAIVNETMAHRYWPGQDAIGQTFHSRGSEGPVYQIVGVCADHKVTAITEPPTPFLHIARSQQPNMYSAIIARTRGDASALLRDMRREIHAVEPGLAFVENQTMEAEVGVTLFPVRASAWLVGSVGMVAMLLAAVGLYGVIAFTVARRTREIGIRMALGARPSMVLRLVMRRGLAVAVVGLIVGCIGSVFVMHRLAGALYGVGANDPLSWLSAAASLLGISALANMIPAWRAARVHPSEALRTE